ncbi:hypothetical protein [Phenylobacterium deserti]|nr:hypothetical protein [Phenylobacterium deserti]
MLTAEQALAWLNLEGPGKAGFAEPAPAGTYTLAHAPREQIIGRELRRML